MRRCDSGRLVERDYQKGRFYVIRLNVVDDSKEGRKRFTAKEISTYLPVGRKNKTKAAAMLIAAIEDFNKDIDTNHITLAAYCDQWLEQKRPTVEITSYEGYEYRLLHVKKYFKDKIMAEIKPADIRNFYHYLITDTIQRNGKTIQGYSNRTIKDTAMLLVAILADAVTMEIIRKKPAEGIKVPQRPVENEQRTYLAADQVESFRREIAGHRLEVPFLMALYYGMRREEILGLKWSAIRDDKIYIEHTVSRVKTTISKDRAKTEARHRAYPLTSEMQECLAEIKEQQRYFREQLGQEYKNTDYVFTWEDGRLYTPDYLTKSFKKLVKRSDVLDNRLTLHSLRASYVNILIHSGVDMKDTQVWVGHRDISTTMNVYASTNERQQKAAAGTMDRIIFQKSKGKPDVGKMESH